MRRVMEDFRRGFEELRSSNSVGYLFFVCRGEWQEEKGGSQGGSPGDGAQEEAEEEEEERQHEEEIEIIEPEEREHER